MFRSSSKHMNPPSGRNKKELDVAKKWNDKVKMKEERSHSGERQT